jgi:hypothetical protein
MPLVALPSPRTSATPNHASIPREDHSGSDADVVEAALRCHGANLFRQSVSGSGHRIRRPDFSQQLSGPSMRPR